MHCSRSLPSNSWWQKWLGGRSCQGRQPPKAGAAGPPLQDLPPSHTRPPRSTAGNISSAGCLKTGPQYTQLTLAIIRFSRRRAYVLPEKCNPRSLRRAQKSGFSAVGTSEYVPGCHWRFSGQTSSSHSSESNACRNVTVADQGIANAPLSSTVSSICSPFPL